MEFLKITFPNSGVQTYLFIPPLVSFGLAFFGVMGGVTGAFLLLPFQFSVLHYTSPGVSATNLLYNLFTIPPALIRYRREGRFLVPLTVVMILGTTPGMFLGYLLRLKIFQDPARFKLLIGLVLLCLAIHTLKNLLTGSRSVHTSSKILLLRSSPQKLIFSFGEKTYEIPVIFTWGVSFLVGIIGGAYGIGGGVILAPFLISVLRLPVHAVAGSTLATTFLASIFGLLVYGFGPGSGPDTRPDLLLGSLFGLGGIIGAYLGARFQKRIPERPIKWGLFGTLLFIALKYLFEAF
ncbi:MAG TPA: sulfite exporter TauE/SafE family protein [Thermodesulfobacteriaceae bacterium]|nr:sulfite exporter TauE/SafE family protein [Thermodesulfobacteriaceae bacterium]